MYKSMQNSQFTVIVLHLECFWCLETEVLSPKNPKVKVLIMQDDLFHKYLLLLLLYNVTLFCYYSYSAVYHILQDGHLFSM